MIIKKDQTAQALVFLMVDSTDHVTGKTGLSPTVTLSKNGGSFASPAGSVTEIANGFYKVAGNATDANTLGSLALHASATGADPTDVLFDVVAYDMQDAVRLGLTAMPNAAAGASGGLPLSVDSSGRVDVLKINGTSQTARDIGASVLLSPGTGTGQLSITSGVVDAHVNDIENEAISNATFAKDTTVKNIRSGLAQDGAAQSITLDASASAVDNFYSNNCLIEIVAGAGVGQARRIVGYVGSTKVATVALPWVTNPTNNSEFVIKPCNSPTGALSSGFVTASGSTTTVALKTGDTWATSFLIGAVIRFIAGTGAGQVRSITANTNANPSVLTVDRAFTTQPDTTTIYEIYSSADSLISAGDIASNAIAAAKIATGAITSAKFAAGAIDNAAIADGAITSGKLATDSIAADAIKADAVTKIQNGLATTANVSAVETDTQDIQNRLPTALVDGKMDSHVNDIAHWAITADAIKDDAVTRIQVGLSKAEGAKGTDAIYDKVDAIPTSSAPTVEEIRQEMDTNSIKLSEIKSIISEGKEGSIVRFVSKDGDDSDGLTWATAYLTMAQATADIASNGKGGFIYMSAGEWEEDVEIPDDTVLIGWAASHYTRQSELRGKASGSTAPTLSLGLNAKAIRIRVGKQSGADSLVRMKSNSAFLKGSIGGVGVSVTKIFTHWIDGIFDAAMDVTIEDNWISGSNQVQNAVNGNFDNSSIRRNTCLQLLGDHIKDPGSLIDVEDNTFLGVASGKYAVNASGDYINAVNNQWNGDGEFANLTGTGSIEQNNGPWSTGTAPTVVQIRQEMDSNSTKLANLPVDLSTVAKIAGTKGTDAIYDKVDANLPVNLSAVAQEATVVAGFAAGSKPGTAQTITPPADMALNSTVAKEATVVSGFSSGAKALDLAQLITQGFGRLEFDMVNSKAYIWEIGGGARKYQATLSDVNGAPVTANTVGPINMSEWTVI